MSNCTQCNSVLPVGAQFCPECGTKQSLLVATCTYCGKRNEAEAGLCIHCGESLFSDFNQSRNNDGIAPIYKAKFQLDFSESVRLPVQLRTYFLKTLRERLESEGNSDLFDEYVDAFYGTAFLKFFDSEALEMAEQCYLLQNGNSSYADRQVDKYLTEKFEGLINTIVEQKGPNFHNNPLTEEVLAYENTSVANQQMGDLVLDYLNMEEEQEQWYRDISAMPKLKLKNAMASFLHTDPMERIFLICDQTIFGSCREGFALTDKALYWKAHFNTAQQLNYTEIKTIELSEDWLVINGKFFNANPAINVKMMHLLTKLRGTGAANS